MHEAQHESPDEDAQDPRGHKRDPKFRPERHISTRDTHAVLEEGPQGLVEACMSGDLEAVIGLLAAGVDMEDYGKVGDKVTHRRHCISRIVGALIIGRDE